MGVDPDDNAAAKVIAQRLSPEKQAWFDNLALRGAHEYAVELENENAALREQLADTAKMAAKAGETVTRYSNENTALRERLAQVEKERDELQRTNIALIEDNQTILKNFKPAVDAEVDRLIAERQKQ